jgi:hypothetical protein
MPHVVPVLRLYSASGEVLAPNPYVIHTVLQIMKLDRSTKPKDIVKAISHEYNQSINYSAAHSVLGAITGTSIDEQRAIPSTGAIARDGTSSRSVRIHQARHRSEYICWGISRCSSPCKGAMFHLQADWSLCAEMP